MPQAVPGVQAPMPQRAPSVNVQSAPLSEIIREVVVQGNQRIEPETVRSYILLQEGDAFNAERVDRSLKSLFSTGLFADVNLKRQGTTLIVSVVENPIVNRVAFEGNKRVKDETLTPEVQLKPRTVYTRTKVQNDVKRILEIYRRQGRFTASVEPKIVQLEQNRVDLIFEIDEGKRTGIRRINFVGNKFYGDSRLREELQTKEERWWRFFSSDDSYDPDRVTYDRELLRRFYLKRGFADFRVLAAVAELTPTRDDFFITFTIEEGARYKFRKVGLDVAVKDAKGLDLSDAVQVSSGDWYNANKIEESVQKLTDLLGNKGIPFIEVKPRIERDREAKAIDVVFDIQDGPRVFVDRIEIAGNTRTLDKVIRREFRLVEGDAFNAAKLRRSRTRLQDLSFFEKVEVNNVPSEDMPDRTVIKVDVQEKSTGELSFGVGWSTQAGAMFEIGVRERNLLGRGQDLKVSLSVGQRMNQIDLSFTEPYFMDREVSAGFDLFHITKNLQRQSAHDEKTTGGGLRAGYKLTENLSQRVGYGLRQTDIFHVKSSASTYIKAQEGVSTVSEVSQILLYDRRDSRLAPTEGYFTRLSNNLAGLGGTERFLRSSVDAAYYYPVTDQSTLKVSGDVSYIVGIGKDIRMPDRYFMGSENLRGFAPAGVGPRDKSTRDALGGNWMTAASLEYSFPIGLPNEYGISGKIFSDVGTIGNGDNQDPTLVYTSTMIRSSIGFGFNWKSPMGPMSIDFGFPITKEPFDKTETLRFNFGTRF